MRIGFSGTHSTGKTTLLDELRGIPEFSNYHFDVNVTRWIRDLGLPINQGTSDASQEINMACRSATAHTYTDLIADRTVYDVLAYTLYGHGRGTISQESLEKQRNWFNGTVGQYDHVFYIPPEIDLIADGTRSEDVTYRNEIDQILRLTYNYANECSPKKLKIHMIAGTVEQRIFQIKNILSINEWSN